MEQSIYDPKRESIYRDRVQTSLIDRLTKTDSMVQPHYHPYYELFYVLEGKCRMFVEHSLYIIKAGELLIIPPSTLHRTQYEDKVERITFSFTPLWAKETEFITGPAFLREKLCSGKLIFNDGTRAELEKIFFQLLKENDVNDDYSEINRKSLLLQLLTFIARNYNQKSGESLINSTELSIQNAAAYIFNNYMEDITLQAAAEIAGMRDTYFSRKFQEVTGYGFKEYLTNIRIQHSQEMLVNSGLTITQIALACGFTNSNYFGDAFKKCMGISPRDFRKHSQKQ